MLALPLLCQWNQDTGMHQETKSLTLKFGRVFQYNRKKTLRGDLASLVPNKLRFSCILFIVCIGGSYLFLRFWLNVKRIKPAQQQKLDHLRRALVSTPLINWRKGSKRVGFMRRWLCRTSAITADTSWGECLPGCRGVYGSVMSQREIINIQILQNWSSYISFKN